MSRADTGRAGAPGGTPGTLMLARAKIAFAVHPYDYAAQQLSGDDHHKGEQAAHALGLEPHRVFKTLMAEADGKPVCIVIPVDRSLSMKKIAAHFGAKSAVMMAPDKAERLTGYHVGGISPFGAKRRFPVVIDEAAREQSGIFINAGKRGLLLEIAPEDAVKAVQGCFAPVCSD